MQDDCLKNHSAKICQYINQITLGDTLELKKKLPSNSIDLIIEDPPYGINYYTNHRKNRINTSDGIKNDQKNNTKFLKASIKENFRLLKNNSHLYMFTRWDKVGEHDKLLRDQGFNIKNHLIWDKGNTSMGDLKGAYGNEYEVIIFAQKGRKELNCLETNQKTTCRHPDILEFQRVSNGNSMLHQHQKPIELLEFLIKKSSNENDVVLDGFGGSGSTAIASMNTNRDWISSEIDNEIQSIATERIKKHNQLKKK